MTPVEMGDVFAVAGATQGRNVVLALRGATSVAICARVARTGRVVVMRRRRPVGRRAVSTGRSSRAGRGVGHLLR